MTNDAINAPRADLSHGSKAGDALALGATCPVPLNEYAEVSLGHGSGGKLTHRLIEQVIAPQFSNPLLDPLHDGAILTIGGSRLAFSTDSFVVNPIFFPGGDIGTLAINGTVNDLAMCGARPLYLSAGFIIEEGLAMDEFRRVVQSMKAAAGAADVSIVTGDTKVVDRGKGDRIYINTAGIGLVREGVNIHPRRAAVGDKIIVSGPIGIHGICIMSVRENLAFESEITSDTAPLHGLVESMLAVCPDLHVLRDPTRGGITSTLSEIAEQSHKGVLLDEVSIPVTEDVRAACEILGLDPLYVANEGKLIAVVSAKDEPRVLATMREHPLGAGSAVIGEIVADHPGMVVMNTRVGGSRVVGMLAGEQLPRIC
jgi:hydrogenase expression/formation protein HypE